MDIYKEERPWGIFEQFVKNKICTVKILTINPGEKLSLQYHHHREEFWRVIEGRGIFIIGDKELTGTVGDEFSVKKKERHRIINTSTAPVRVLEIALGVFDEDDIVRLEDKYKRK